MRIKRKVQDAVDSGLRVVAYTPRPNPQNLEQDPAVFKRYANGREFGVVSEESFLELLSLERKRSERSGKPFLLMLLDVRSFAGLNGKAEARYRKAFSVVAVSTRETDIKGWYAAGATLGVIFTELNGMDRSTLAEMIRGKVESALDARFDAVTLGEVHLSFHWFPDELDEQGPSIRRDETLYPDQSRQSGMQKFALGIKRMMDMAGSALALLIFSPLFFLIAAGIKLTSAGPVLFRQKRVGQHGNPFTFLKFRTMRVENDPAIHREYVARLIKGKVKSESEDGTDSGIFKILNDPRVTPFGRVLRKLSLDEVPQFWNVLRGEMSLVGPRPPIPYELESYNIWHRRRVLDVKPGITGLWQVTGRSRTTFDEMVRLDLRYARSWSPWQDVKILLRTPKAVLSGDGAY